MKLLPGLLAVLVLAGGGGFRAGLAAYSEGRFADALAAFTAAELEDPENAFPELLYNRALAALRAGELRVAEISAEKAAARGGRRFQGLCDFLLGNAAFTRCLRGAAETELTSPDPTAFERAIGSCRNAIEFWQRAAAGRPDWPQARRNVERALLKLDELRDKKAEAQRQRQSKKAKPPKPKLEDDPNARKEQEEIDKVKRQKELISLTPEQLAQLLERLAQTEREKRRVRRDRQRVRTIAAERDW